MTLFSKFTKHGNNEKTIHPWSQRKLNGSNAALPRFGHGATMVDSQYLLVFGGYHKGNTKKNLFLIDTNTLSATSIQATGDIPSPRSFTAITCINGLVLLFGGEPIIAGDQWDSELYILYTNSKQWSKIRVNSDMPRGRSGHTISAHNGKMYVWGGQHQGQYLNDLLIFSLKDYPAKAEWEFVPSTGPAPSPRAGHISVVYDNKLYIFGGINASHLYNDIWCLDLVTRVWSQVEAVGYIPAPRESCAAALVDDTIYIFGGRGLNGFTLGDLYAFRIKSRRWYTFQNMGSPPSARYGATLTLNQNKIFVFGGDSLYGKVDDGSYVYILDCSKIKYPPEEVLEDERKTPIPRHLNPPGIVLNDTKEILSPPSASKLELQAPNIPQMQQYTTLPDRPSKPEECLDRRMSTSVAGNTSSKQRPYQQSVVPSPTPPPRPPREGVMLNIPKRTSDPDSEDKSRLLREIMARDAIITEMQKKEQWWRTEVSISRHLRTRLGEEFADDVSAQEAALYSFEDDDSKDDKLLLFEQLINSKTEVRKIKNTIAKQSELLFQNLLKAEKIRTVALEEASYYRSKYTALKAKDKTALGLLETDRVELLEKRLRDAYAQRDNINMMLSKVQKQSQEDQTARLLAEERASIAQKQSEMAQEAHQAALEKISKLYSQILKAESKCRDDAIYIADLSNKLATQLSLRDGDTDLSEIHIKMVHLEAANIKCRNEVAALLKQLEENQDEQEALEALLGEKDHVYAETLLELEKVRIELELVRRSTASNIEDNTQASNA
ncbi:hypothetical protein RMCBS344292_07168 [Rhizopus microsporus]|nr:hypothetical protein RMCBS344292_07168 [Rhizopus microsporus]